MDNNVANYLAEIQADLSTGRAREHTYRTAFKQLIENVDNVRAQNEPTRSEHGSPDFLIFPKSNADLILCYAETKDLGIDLDRVEKSDQLRRYFGYPNLILTNYLDFRFFHNGEREGDPIVIAILSGSTLSQKPESFSVLINALTEFLQGKPEAIKSGKRLAEIMGGKARRIRDNVQHYLASKTEASLGLVYETVKKLLVHDLTPETFSDMYAQTLVYGLFVARFHDDSPETFSRQEARDLIPASNPFLRHFFDHIVGPDFDKRLGYIVNELCEIFRVTDVQALMRQYFETDLFGNERTGPDPVIHFYEDFLQEYDSGLRKKMGAYYTPLPVVDFIVRSVDSILENEFGLSAGLADTTKIGQVHKVQILDPAVGTGTFLNETIRAIYARFENQKGRWPAYVHHDLLPRLHGFELMMAPYTIAHLKLSMVLKETGFYYFNQTRNGLARLGIYLTNSLEESIIQSNLFGGLGLEGSIAEESKEASKIKNEKPIMVVIGNPPYSGESSNANYKGNDVYKIEPSGGKLKERNPKWLNDDYVKFIHFAEHFIEKNKSGIVAMITAHGYIDNPTFRGMRWHLASTFDEIFVLDLHGNANKKEMALDGSVDENVFNIKQGVAIFIGIKKDEHEKKKLATIYRADILGSREYKFDYLNKSDVKKVEWQRIKPVAPNYEWVARDEGIKNIYDQGFSVAEFFPVSSVGIVTARDAMSIQFTKKEIEDVVNDFINLDVEVLRQKYDLGKDVQDWKVEWAKKDIVKNYSEDKFIPIAYRPFDIRWTFYTGTSRGFLVRPRSAVMKQMLNDNLALVALRQVKAGDKYQHLFVSRGIVESTLISNKTSEIDYTFPLYFYSEDGVPFGVGETGNIKTDRIPNVEPAIARKIAESIGVVYYPVAEYPTKSKDERLTPEDIFDYIYAALHSPSYREKYKEFLKIYFPRVPYPKDKKQFQLLATLGKELKLLHLLESSKINKFTTTYPTAGTNIVEKIVHQGGKVFINSNQYFGNIPEIAWNFYIGGYQPAQKWLKDRKGRTLDNDDIEHYQKMIVALVETDRIMKEIDEVIFV